MEKNNAGKAYVEGGKYIRKLACLLGIILIISVVAGCGASSGNTKQNQNNTATSKVVQASSPQLPLPLPPLKPGWQRRVIGNIGSIDFPQNLMEEQNRAWRQSGDAQSKAMGLPVVSQDTVIIQQQGSVRYARIIITEVKGVRGEFPKLFDRNYFSKAELKDFDSQMSQKLRDDFSKMPGMKLLEYYPARLQDLNGMQPLVASYRRQLANNPPVLVWEYRFMNNSSMVQIIMSYRQTEDDIWGPVFQKCLESLRIQTD